MKHMMQGGNEDEEIDQAEIDEIQASITKDI
jgi:hypothetical protein